MRSIQEVGLQEPIDVLEVDGSIWWVGGGLAAACVWAEPTD